MIFPETYYKMDNRYLREENMAGGFSYYGIF